MSRKASQPRSTTAPSEREELLEAMLVDTPELSFTPRGDPDPRLVRLVEFLARQAAREFYEAPDPLISGFWRDSGSARRPDR